MGEVFSFMYVVKQKIKEGFCFFKLIFLSGISKSSTKTGDEFKNTQFINFKNFELNFSENSKYLLNRLILNLSTVCLIKSLVSLTYIWK